MGLDNSIEVRRTPETNKINELRVFSQDYMYNFEICYFRKCYNVRSMVIERVESFRDGIGTPLTKYDVDNIIDGLKSFNADNWDDNGGSIWEWDDEEWPYSEKIQHDIESLQLLRKLMDKYDLDVYFYDSY